ncbi:hypothetical protein FACS189494_00600 [Spirochaetia bacterium]|nr:hypothetical protein FACS189494_00600 [Spirochaetia bacterium]
MNKGRFIVIEGLDGCGKSTQIGLLKTYLDGQNIKNVFVHYPRLETGVYGELISRFLRGEFGSAAQVHPVLAAVLFAGDRRDNDSSLRNYIKDGYLVLCDRYIYSNIAFQCAKLKEQKEKDQFTKWILDFEYGHNNILKPDLNIFLNMPLDFIIKNLTAMRTGGCRDYLRGQKDIHESDLTLQKNVQCEYEKLFDKTTINETNITAGNLISLISIDCFEGGRVLLPQEINKKIIGCALV